MKYGDTLLKAKIKPAIMRKDYRDGTAIEITELTETSVEYRYVWNDIPGRLNFVRIRVDKSGKKYFGKEHPCYFDIFKKVIQ